MFYLQIIIFIILLPKLGIQKKKKKPQNETLTAKTLEGLTAPQVSRFTNKGVMLRLSHCLWLSPRARKCEVTHEELALCL